MTTNYDPIAEQYQRSKQQPWRTHVEAFNFMKLIGDPTGKEIIDIACGEGFYTRMLRRRGASRVTGVDLSGKMIALARAAELEQHLGIDYLVADARDLKPANKYDLAVAAYLLNYARDPNELAAMSRAIAGCLRPGGRFVTVNSSPRCDFSSAPSYRKYGFETSVVGKFREGAPITWTFYLEDAQFQIENYFFGIETHENALRAAGFREIHWHSPVLSPEGEAADGSEYWSDLLSQSPIMVLECLV
jgi:ubiquinone/menaquinone biosynthesis C-methylase UbiE